MGVKIHPLILERGAHLGVGILAQNIFPPQSGAKKGPTKSSDRRNFFSGFPFNASNPGGEKGFLQRGVFRILVLVRPRCNIGSENRIPAGKLSLRWLQTPISVAFS